MSARPHTSDVTGTFKMPPWRHFFPPYDIMFPMAEFCPGWNFVQKAEFCQIKIQPRRNISSLYDITAAHAGMCPVCESLSEPSSSGSMVGSVGWWAERMVCNPHVVAPLWKVLPQPQCLPQFDKLYFLGCFESGPKYRDRLSAKKILS